MNFILKGITQSDTLDYCKSLSLENLHLKEVSFDLRPRSFNFIQIHKLTQFIKSIHALNGVSIQFENEVSLSVSEILKKCSEECPPGQRLWPEFSGHEDVSIFENFATPYAWHYHGNQKIKNIGQCQFLKRIIFKHHILEDFNQRGELHSFMALFSEFAESIEFELQLDWDSEIILSLFDYFTFHFISFEINRKVELSYQRPDHLLIKKNLEQIDTLFKA